MGSIASSTSMRLQPPEGWARWCDRQIEEADFVLVVSLVKIIQHSQCLEKPRPPPSRNKPRGRGEGDGEAREGDTEMGRGN